MFMPGLAPEWERTQFSFFISFKSMPRAKDETRFRAFDSHARACLIIYQKK